MPSIKTILRVILTWISWILSQPAETVAFRVAKRTEKNAHFGLLIVFMVQGFLIWIISTGADNLQNGLSKWIGPSTSAIVMGALGVYAFVQFVTFNARWHRTLNNDFGSMQLVARLDLARIAGIGRRISVWILATYSAYVFVEYFGIRLPNEIKAVPVVAFLVGFYVLRIRLSEQDVLKAAFEGVENIRKLERRCQTYAIRLLRRTLAKALHQSLPLVDVDLSKIFNMVYLISMQGTPEEQANMAKFLDKIKANSIGKINAQGLIEVFNSHQQFLTSTLYLNQLISLKFEWEKRVEWYHLIERISFPVFFVSALIALIPLIPSFLQWLASYHP